MKMYDITNQIPSCNYFESRGGYKPKAIVLHITGDSAPHQATNWFKDKTSKVSAHYVIEKDGSVYMCVKPQHKAYHCGAVLSPTAKIYFDNNSDNPNLYTIGIECVTSYEPLTYEQHLSLLELIRDLCNAYNIPKDRYHIIGHYELDSITRASDPIASYRVDVTVRELGVKKKMFKDADKIGEYAKEAVDNLEKLGIIHGDTDGNFNPLEPITRQDMAVIVNNLLKVKSL